MYPNLNRLIPDTLCQLVLVSDYTIYGVEEPLVATPVRGISPRTGPESQPIRTIWTEQHQPEHPTPGCGDTLHGHRK